MIYKDQIYKDSIILLFENSRKAILFNIILSLLLAIDLGYHNIPPYIVWPWFTTISMFSILRWVFSTCALKRIDEKNKYHYLTLFFMLTLCMGILWSLCYILTLPYLAQLQEFIIILVYGGMCAGAITSLSVHLPSYLAYVLPIFLPVIIYNYSLLNFDRAILATTFLLYVIGVMIFAKINNKLLKKIFHLSSEKETLIMKLKHKSITDPLTNLFNRRQFENILKNEFNRAKRNKYSIILISFDIDNFKLINDAYGHYVGDMILIYVSHLLKTTFRRTNDFVFRVGGDEFFVILSNSTKQEAMNACEKIKSKVNLSKFHLNKNNSDILDKITISSGIVVVPFDSSCDPKQASIEADKALYRSKQQGKNKIIFHELYSKP